MPTVNKRNNRASRYAAPIGGVFIVLCIIGFFSLVSGCFQFTRNLLDNTQAKHDYERMILPVIMFDPPPFEDPTTLRQVDVLMYSVWSAVLSDKRDIYEYDDNMSLVIPASDVETAAYNLFGPGLTHTHDTFGDYDVTYVYEESTKSYHVPVSAMTGFYTPRVEEITRKGDIITLRVGYIPPKNALDIDLSGRGEKEQAADKYMNYLLKKVKRDYFLFAIQDVEGNTMPGVTADNPVLDGMVGGELGDNQVSIDEQMEFLPQPSSSESSAGDSSSSSESSAGDSSSSSSSSSDSDEGDGSSGDDAGSESSGSEPPGEVVG